jgi:nucleoside-diphosphate-sugar epimerase
LKILVTGATGLIGCHAAARLALAGHEVRALVRERAKLARVLAPFPGARVEAVPGDVTDAASVEAALAGCEGVLHCAGVFSHDLGAAERLRRVNVEGTRNVLGAAARLSLAPIVHVSSLLALRFPPPGPRQRADDPVGRPRAMYAATKAEAEGIARELQEGGARLAIVHPSSTHGPFDPTVGSGPEFIANALRAGRVLVTEGGLSYTDVRDLADLLAALFAAGPRPRRIMAPASFLTHARTHALLCELTGRPLAATRLPGRALRLLGRAGDLRQRWLGRGARLTSEAALVLTRSVPVDDGEARELLGADPIPIERSFRDLLLWMHRAGVLEAGHVGRLARDPEPTPV